MPKPICVGQLQDHTKAELTKLANSEDQAVRKRAKVILLSGDYHTMPEISESLGMSYLTVRLWVKRFLEEGIDGLYTRTDTRGRKETFTEEHKNKVIAVACTSPREYGLPFRKWSVGKLSDYLACSEEMQISRETVRRILHSRSIDWRDLQKQHGADDATSESQESPRDDETSTKGIAFHIDDAGSMTVKEDGREMWSSQQKDPPVAKKNASGATNVVATYDPERKEFAIKLAPKE